MAVRFGFPNSPLVDPVSGLLMPVWQGFLLALYNRTGAAAGTSTTDVAAQVATETTAREAADAALQASVSTETAARAGAVAAEAAARTAADAALQGEITALGAARGSTAGPMLARWWFAP